MRKNITLEAFVRESNKIEGILRDPTRDEICAHERLAMLDKLTVADMVDFVSIIQPDARLRDNISVPGVRVGDHIAPPSGPEIREQLQYLLAKASDNWDWRMTNGDVRRNTSEAPSLWQIHCDYETLHPFTDGNGRSGRALWLWGMGGHAPLGFLHQFYYQTLSAYR